MVVKLFILGRPGCGKSLAAKYIVEQIQAKDWSYARFKDYEILHRMYREDSLERFRSADHNGFDVLDFSVLDEALKELEEKVPLHTPHIDKQEFILIEFARNNYIDAFKLFSPDFLRDAYFLFIDADLAICKDRVHERIKNPKDDDDHPVSDFALDNYYLEQPFPTENELTKNGWTIKNDWIIENQDSLIHFKEAIDHIVAIIFNDLRSA